MDDGTSLIRETYLINFQRLKTAIFVLIPFHLLLIIVDLQRLFSGVVEEHAGYRYLYTLHLFLLLILAVYLFLFTRSQAEEALRRNSEQELRTITDNIADVVAIADIEGRFIYISESSHTVFGYKPEELVGKSIVELVHEDDILRVGTTFHEGLAEGKESANIEHRVRHKNGHYIWVEAVGRLITDDNGKPSGALFTSRDISERKQAEEALRLSEEKYRQITDNMSDVVWITDMNLKTIYVSPSIERVVGESVHVHMNRALEEKHPPEAINLLISTIQEEIEKDSDLSLDKNRSRLLEVEYYKVDGSAIWLSMHISAVRDNEGSVIGFQGVTRDISDRKEAEEQIRYIGFHDQLTGLHNRHYFESCTEELKNIPLLSVIMTDVNGLKLINDTYGHKVGDELLKKYAELLKGSFKKSDLIFRWGGDEFIIILKNIKEAKSWDLFNRLIKHCGEIFVKDIPLSISVGISSKLEGGGIDKAIQEAEDMMYKNKLTESKSSKNLIMKTLLQTLSEKSFETKEHIDRMTLFGRQFGERLSLSPSELSRLEALAMLHDIGKINIDSHILLKETALTDQEWVEIKKHPEVGYRITRTTEEFAYIAEEILAHHERWDGNGYPQGLGGEDIPYLARILNLIDSYDVMSNGRPYKKKMTAEEIVEEIESCSGKQFDPKLAKEFIACLKEEFIGFG